MGLSKFVEIKQYYNFSLRQLWTTSNQNIECANRIQAVPLTGGLGHTLLIHNHVDDVAFYGSFWVCAIYVCLSVTLHIGVLYIPIYNSRYASGIHICINVIVNVLRQLYIFEFWCQLYIFEVWCQLSISVCVYLSMCHSAQFFHRLCYDWVLFIVIRVRAVIELHSTPVILLVFDFVWCIYKSCMS